MDQVCRNRVARRQWYEDHGSYQVVQLIRVGKELAMMVRLNIKMLMGHSRILEEAMAAVMARCHMGHLLVRELQGW